MKRPRDRPARHRKTGSKKPTKGRKKGPGGHPADNDPRVQAMRDKENRKIRGLVSDIRREAFANPDEGYLVGPLAVAAKHAAELLCKRHEELHATEHRHGVANYLTEQLGAVIDGFDPNEYRAWRQICEATTALREVQS